jgi:hypothetical protein
MRTHEELMRTHEELMRTREEFGVDAWLNEVSAAHYKSFN